MEELVLHKEKENKKTGFYLSLGVHILILLLLLVPCLSYMDPPLELQGVMVVFGNENAGEPEQQNQQETPAATAPEISEEKVEQSAPAKFVKAVETPDKTQQEEPVKTEVISETKEAFSEIVAVEKKKTQKELEAEKRQREEAEAKARAEAVEKKRKEEEAKNQAQYKSAKSKFGSLLSNSKSASKGTEESEKGNPLGKPDAKALEGISKGSGRVGGGLSNRGLLYEPNFSDNSQKSGTVVVKICVNQNGNVISSKFTQKGSTTTDSYLVSLAEKEAKKYKFSSSNISEQCGTITVQFKVQ